MARNARSVVFFSMIYAKKKQDADDKKFGENNGGDEKYKVIDDKTANYDKVTTQGVE